VLPIGGGGMDENCWTGSGGGGKWLGGWMGGGIVRGKKLLV